MKLTTINDRNLLKVHTKEEKINQTDKNRYLGSMLTDDWRSDTEIKIRITRANPEFNLKQYELCFEKKSGRVRSALARYCATSTLRTF